jgi:hypothetical protein
MRGFDNALNFKAWISDAVFNPAHIDKGFTKTVGTPLRATGRGSHRRRLE